MTWFKVDDTFHAHPKVLATDAAALGLWVVAGAWSSAHLTEGFVPDHALPRLIPGSDVLARKLVATGLWRRTRGGYQFHDWAEYQPTKEEAVASRDGMSSGGALGNHRRWHIGKGKKNPTCRYCIGSSAPDGPDEKAISSQDSVTSARSNNHRVKASGRPVENQQSDTDLRRDQEQRQSAPDQVPDGIPESGANPPTRPDPGTSRGRSRSSTHDRTRAASEPPQPQCPEHLGMTEAPPCGACADARRARTRWDIADAERRRNAPKCRSHRGQPADNCALCRSEALAAEEAP